MSSKRGSGRQRPIHSSIKQRLGYPTDEPDKDILRDWRERLGRVCKPCWELKYCPYGPLVEQSPLLPSDRAGAVKHNEHLRKVIETGFVGEEGELDDERRDLYMRWVADEDVLAEQAFFEVGQEWRDAKIAASGDPAEAFEDMFRGDLPPIHEYRVNFNVMGQPLDINSLGAGERLELKRRIRERKKRLKKALKDGREDRRRPLDEGRRAWFAKQIAKFDADEYPEEIPDIFRDGECNIFGHICPVFFTAEVITETSTERRRGRYIPFALKMRVVRRDNHTCQHCGKHLADNEVEFDHRIPISRGGSSEEHNIRLTCFECNRDKSDKVEI